MAAEDCISFLWIWITHFWRCFVGINISLRILCKCTVVTKGFVRCAYLDIAINYCKMLSSGNRTFHSLYPHSVVTSILNVRVCALLFLVCLP